MTRRDRAAMQLALEILRTTRPRVAIDTARSVLHYGGPGAYHVYVAMVDAISEMRGGSQWRRLLRARLALYLRAVLRADRDDCGPRWCVPCGPDYSGGCECWDLGRPLGPRSRRITPLWERARPHEVQP